MWNTFNVAKPSPDQPNSLLVSLGAQGWEWKFGFSKKICRNHENIKHNTSVPLSIGHYDLLKTKKYPETPLSWTHSYRHVWAWLGNSAHIQPVLIFLGCYLYAKNVRRYSFPSKKYWWLKDSVILLDETTFWPITWNYVN